MARETSLDGPKLLFVKLIPFASSIHLPTNYLTALLIVGVNDIGFISCLIDFGSFIFGIATTFSFFQIVGTTSTIDELKIQARGLHKANAKSYKNQFGWLSGPGAWRISM